ncbi:uncharacterized protein LOC117178700 [Belonocnema kinseyi]|uniref:uncharacterized protein LOC117178700 n=1 Tax=Belonocnema kinseyi TaxID=2817044 RepID=UPI00143DEF2D|nr:uncharacterized protein LOC117178700 [Belonocnema kinseyi]
MSVQALNTECTSQSMGVDVNSDECEDVDAPITWTSNFMNTLKSIVEMHAFVEEDDETRNETCRKIENINVQIRELDLKEVERNVEEAQGDCDEEFEPNRNQFQKLHEFLNKEEIYTPIDVPVKVNVAEPLLMLIKFALVSCIGFSTVASLFMLVVPILTNTGTPSKDPLHDPTYNPKYYDRTSHPQSFCVGSKVALKVEIRNDMKFDPFFEGQYVIEELIGEANAQIRVERTNKLKVVNLDKPQLVAHPLQK